MISRWRSRWGRRPPNRMRRSFEIRDLHDDFTQFVVSHVRPMFFAAMSQVRLSTS